MRKILMASIIFGVSFVALRPATAQPGYVFPADEAPWCAVINLGPGGGDYWDCRYATLEACVPNVIAGNRGHCNMNPRFPGWSARSYAPRPRRHH
jgi:hypothetical protein